MKGWVGLRLSRRGEGWGGFHVGVMILRREGDRSFTALCDEQYSHLRQIEISSHAYSKVTKRDSEFSRSYSSPAWQTSSQKNFQHPHMHTHKRTQHAGRPYLSSQSNSANRGRCTTNERL